MSSVNGTRCCARCKSPYGHVAAAGVCCHPSEASVAMRELLRVQEAAEAEMKGARR